jgi:cytidylate kinase
MRKIICIGRQYGSGGHRIAQAAAEQLGIPCYDREILEMAIKDSGIASESIANTDEKAPNAWMYSILYEGVNKHYYGKISNDILFDLEKKIILEAAKRSDCIFVGRCADAILKGSPDCCVKSIFIRADPEARITEIMNRCQCSRKQAASRIRKTDDARKNYYRTYCGGSWGEDQTYDYILDSSKLTQEQLLDTIRKIYAGLS